MMRRSHTGVVLALAGVLATPLTAPAQQGNNLDEAMEALKGGLMGGAGGAQLGVQALAAIQAYSGGGSIKLEEFPDPPPGHEGRGLAATAPDCPGNFFQAHQYKPGKQNEEYIQIDPRFCEILNEGGVGEAGNPDPNLKLAILLSAFVHELIVSADCEASHPSKEADCCDAVGYIWQKIFLGQMLALPYFVEGAPHDHLARFFMRTCQRANEATNRCNC